MCNNRGWSERPLIICFLLPRLKNKPLDLFPMKGLIFKSLSLWLALFWCQIGLFDKNPVDPLASRRASQNKLNFLVDRGQPVQKKHITHAVATAHSLLFNAALVRLPQRPAHRATIKFNCSTRIYDIFIPAHRAHHMIKLYWRRRRNWNSSVIYCRDLCACEIHLLSHSPGRDSYFLIALKRRQFLQHQRKFSSV